MSNLHQRMQCYCEATGMKGENRCVGCPKRGTDPTPDQLREADMPRTAPVAPFDLPRDHPAVKLLLRVYNEIDPDPTLEDEIGKYLKSIGAEES